MQGGFSKDITLLEETSRIDDLLDFSFHISEFKKYLSNIRTHSIVSVVGNFGSGKSTMLYQIEKENHANWIVFDAWAFPSRKDLWEGFVLDFARKISPKEFLEARKSINGEKYFDEKILIKIIASGFNFFLPGAGIVENFANLFKSSPARRIFEFRDILASLIKKQKRDLFIVLEDVDRSGREGAVFLETVKQFIDNELNDYIDSKITFIVPIGTKNFEGEFADSYKKSIDYKFDFKPKLNFAKFISDVFDEKLFVKNNNFWGEQLDYLFNCFIESGGTVRELKQILRNANNKFISQQTIENFSPDPRITILIGLAYALGGLVANIPRTGDMRSFPFLFINNHVFHKVYCESIEQNQKTSTILRQYEGRNDLLKNVVFVQNHNKITPEIWKPFIEKEGTNERQLEISDLYR